MRKNHYVDVKTFEDVKANQDTLIQVLNHTMSEIKIDVAVIKNSLTSTNAFMK